MGSEAGTIGQKERLPSGIDWPAMRTVAEIRHSQNVGAPQQPDSHYKTIERAPRQFSSLKVEHNPLPFCRICICFSI